MYEDLGGCVDDEDEDIFTTVAREAYEESNKLIKKNSIKKRLNKEQIKYSYSPKNKYIVYIVEATEHEQELKSKDFGDTEEHDGFKRTIKWISLDEFLKSEIIKYKLNFRLKNKKLFDILNEIKKEKNNVCMFTS